MSDLKLQLENSQQIIFQLEERSNNKEEGRHQLIDIIRNIRESSSLELKRMVNDAKEKYELTVGSFCFGSDITFLNNNKGIYINFKRSIIIK